MRSLSKVNALKGLAAISTCGFSRGGSLSFAAADGCKPRWAPLAKTPK
jgi:hypothetical protein